MPGYGGSAPLANRQHRRPRRRLCRISCSRSVRRNPILVGHSIGGMIVQQLLVKSPAHRACRRSRTNQPGVRQSRRRLAEILHRARGSARSIAAKRWFRWRSSLVKELVGDDPDARRHGTCARPAWRAFLEATYRATMLALMGSTSVSALKDIAVPTLVLSGSKGQKCAGADDGEDGELYSIGNIC